MTIAVVAVVAAVLLGIGCWGWWAAPRLLSGERDEQYREDRTNELRRGVLAYLLAAAVALWVLADAIMH